MLIVVTIAAGYSPLPNGTTYSAPQITSNQATTPIIGFSGLASSATGTAIMNVSLGGNGDAFAGVVNGTYSVLGIPGSFTFNFTGQYQVALPSIPNGQAYIIHSVTASAATTGGGGSTTPPN